MFLKTLTCKPTTFSNFKVHTAKVPIQLLVATTTKLVEK